MESKQAAASLAALAHATRLEVFRLLVRAGAAGLAAGVIAEKVGIPPQTLSFHLGHLSRAGLVRAQRDGRVIRYAANFDGMRGLLDYLVEDCCRGFADQAQGCCPPTSPPERRAARGVARARRGT